MKTLKFLTIIGIISLGLLSFNKLYQEEWKVPEKYEQMKNGDLYFQFFNILFSDTSI